MGPKTAILAKESCDFSARIVAVETWIFRRLATETGTARLVLEKGFWKGLETGTARLVLEKGLWKGLEIEIEGPGLEKGIWQGLEAGIGEVGI